jgi:hypothetical protein
MRNWIVILVEHEIKIGMTDTVHSEERAEILCLFSCQLPRDGFALEDLTLCFAMIKIW